MNVKLVKLLLLELLERIVLMENFLDNAHCHAAEEADYEVIGSFRDFIKNIKGEIEASVCDMLTDDEREIHENTLYFCFKKTLTLSHIVNILHYHLYTVPSKDVVLSETHIFLNNFSRKIDYGGYYAPVEPTFILWNSYNFRHLKLPDVIISDMYQSLLLKEIMSYRDTIRPTTIIALPKIEFKNSFRWCLLVHELGHAIDTKFGISEKVSKEISASKEDMKILKEWTREVFADLFALKLLGPAYVASLAFFSSLERVLKPEESHPSPNTRILILIKELKNILKKTPEVVEDLINFWDMRCEYGRKYGLDSTENPDIKDFNFGNYESKMVPMVKSEIDRICKQKFNKDNYKKATELCKLVAKGIPISSSRDYDDKKLMKDIDKFKEMNEDIKVILLPKFNEKPNDISEIMNAVWIHRSTILEEFCSTFFENNQKSFEEKYKTFRDELKNIDKITLKSIGTADINSLLMEKGEKE